MGSLHDFWPRLGTLNRSASRPGSQRLARSRGPEAFHRAGPGHALRPGTGRAPGATVHGKRPSLARAVTPVPSGGSPVPPGGNFSNTLLVHHAAPFNFWFPRLPVGPPLARWAWRDSFAGKPPNRAVLPRPARDPARWA